MDEEIFKPEQKAGWHGVEENCRTDEKRAAVAPAVHEVSKDDMHEETTQGVTSQAQPVGQPKILGLKLSETYLIIVHLFVITIKKGNVG